MLQYKICRWNFNDAVLDSGCTKVVCGKTWLSNHIDSLTNDNKVKVTDRKSDTVFKFADWKFFNSLKLVTILPKIDSKYINSTTGVTDTKLPLLLIKNAMKLAKVKIDFDDINIFGENIGISFTESRHYFIPINHTNKAISEVDKSNPTEHFLLNISNISSKTKEKSKIAKKLHCQFGHASVQKLQKLVNLSSIKDDELLNLLVVIEKNLCKI